MSTNYFKRDNEFFLFDFLFWLLLAVVFPVLGGNFNVVNVIQILIYLCSVFYVGEFIFSRIEAIKEIPFLFKSGIYIFLGGIVCGIFFLIIPMSLIIYLIFILFVVDFFVNRKLEFVFSLYNFICLIPFFIILFQTFEFAYATTERYSYWDGDYYFYNAITESLKSNQSPSNAVFHSGLPINYAVLPFFASAHLAHFSSIPSQFALWG
ncbi:hypothetical protein MEO93_27240, partial [Dolichospermum sp. ST_sed3]|nr:hypothetical protein [Dolichospermum sp. ST_sed3]